MKLIEGLAKEIGAGYDPAHESVPFLCVYLLGIVDALGQDAERLRAAVGAGPNRAVLPIATMMFAALKGGAMGILNASELANIGDQAGDLIDLIDCDDGWPECRWLNALKACAISLEFGAEDDPGTRWPAEAGLIAADLLLGLRGVYNADTRAQRLIWVNTVYAKAMSWSAAA